MLIEELRHQSKINFSGKFDIVELVKEGSDKVIIQKIKNGIGTKLYFIFFLIAALLICYYAKNHKVIVIIVTVAIFLSACFFLFLGYKTIFNVSEKTVSFYKNFLFLKWQAIVPFNDILSWSSKSGENGYQIKAKTGESFGFVHKLKEEYIACRLSKREEASDLLGWIQESLIPPK